MKMKNKLKRRDALTIFSILYAYTKDMKANSMCYLALEREKSLSSKRDKEKATKKVINFFENIPNELKDLNEEDAKNTIMNFILELSNYISKYRGQKVFFIDSVIKEIKKEIDYKSRHLNKSAELLSILGKK